MGQAPGMVVALAHSSLPCLGCEKPTSGSTDPWHLGQFLCSRSGPQRAPPLPPTSWWGNLYSSRAEEARKKERKKVTAPATVKAYSPDIWLAPQNGSLPPARG